MSFTAAGNKKMAKRLKAENGVDADGKSIHHKRAGLKARHAPVGYFYWLKQTPDGRKRLAEIGRLGAAASNKKQGKGEPVEDQKTEGV